MKTKSNEFIIGIVVLSAFSILLFSIIWLGKSNFLSKGININLIVENANGIQKGDEVYFRGVKIGSVFDEIITNGGIILKLKIEKFIPIPKDSKFEITDFSLISGKAIEITPGISDINLKSNDTVVGNVVYNVNQAISSLKDLYPKIDKVLINLDSLTNQDTKNKVEFTLKNFDLLISHIKSQIDGNLNDILLNVNDITANNKKSIDTLMGSLHNNSAELSQFLILSSKTVEQIGQLIDNINQGKGSLGNFVVNDSLYINLNHSIMSLDSLITDIKQNPKKYLSIKVF
jgi:phospholipid/cholesterol/gamma-HCH transport system substrate-binding protein